LFEAFNIDAAAILDKDKETIYAGNANIYFTKGIDFEEEIFDLFSFKQYLRYLFSINTHTFMINRLKTKIDGFEPAIFSINPLYYDIPEIIGNEIMLEIRDTEITELRKNKNAINGAALAKYVDRVPESFVNIIEKTILERLA
jgi:hypothetical protein